MAVTRFAPLPANFGGNTYRNSKSTGNRIHTVTDRRLDTSSSETTFLLDIEDAGQASHVFVKAKNLTSIAINDEDDNALVSDTISSYTVQNAQGQTVDFTADGFQNLLYPLDPDPDNLPVTTDTLSVMVAGTNTEVYELAAIDSKIELDAETKFSTFDFRRTQRTYQLHEKINGRVVGIPPLNSEPYRWEIALEILYLNNESYDTVLNFLYEYPNFCFIPEYSRYPSRVFTEATLPKAELQLNYLERTLKMHQILQLTIWEA